MEAVVVGGGGNGRSKRGRVKGAVPARGGGGGRRPGRVPLAAASEPPRGGSPLRQPASLLAAEQRPASPLAAGGGAPWRARGVGRRRSETG